MSTLRRAYRLRALAPRLQFGKQLAVGLLQLAVEDAHVVDGQIDARLYGLPGIWRRQREAACRTKLLLLLSLRARAQANRAGTFQPSTPRSTSRATRAASLRPEAVEIGFVIVLGVVFEQQGWRQAHLVNALR